MREKRVLILKGFKIFKYLTFYIFKLLVNFRDFSFPTSLSSTLYCLKQYISLRFVLNNLL